MDPNASEQVRTGPNRSKQIRKLRKTCENIKKIKNIHKKIAIPRLISHGGVEECAKLLAVMRLGCSCGAATKSPRALCLAGIAAGAGFMAIENMSYFEDAGLDEPEGC